MTTRRQTLQLMAGAAALAAVPAMARSATKDLYERSLVIDSLCFGKDCAEKGGVTGMCALGYFIGPDPGGETTIEHYADHIEHAVSVAGHEHVALSTDFPPQGISPWATKEEWYEPRLEVFKPSYEVRWPPWIPELDSTDRFRNLLKVLDKRGWSEGNLELLLGQNWMRLFHETIG
jgi:membrane dipeptidase